MDDGIERTALISKDKRYRYKLGRAWDSELPPLVWIMLNPSTADAKEDDATVRKCIGFSRLWGFGSLTIVNLFAYRATSPRDLQYADDPVGFFNDGHISSVVGSCTGPVVAAWGTQPDAPNFMLRVRKVVNLPGVEERQLDCVGTNRDRTPRHPLMLPYSSNKIPWRIP